MLDIYNGQTDVKLQVRIAFLSKISSWSELATLSKTIAG
jgi:hypothetical protein